MNQWYCKKCGVNSPGNICSRCGKKLPGNIMRDIWQVYRVPLSDTASWKTAFIVLLSASLIMLFFLLLGESVRGDPSQALRLFSNGTAATCLALVPAGLLCQFILFALQGQEVLVYCLDSDGAHVQTWHKAGRLRSWARFQRAHQQDAVPDGSGGMTLLSQRRTVLWGDVRSVTLMPARGEIRLFSSSRLAPFILRLTNDEYENAEHLVKKACRKVMQ